MTSLNNDWPIVAPIEDGRLRLPANTGGRLGRWYLVFVLNVPICLLLGNACTTGSGRMGMGVGILSLSVIGRELTRRWKRIGVDLAVGGTIFALTQFFPILQIWSGILGLGAVSQAAVSFKVDDLPELAMPFGPALIATLVTGGILMAGALGLGFVSRLVTPRHWRYGPETYHIKSKRLEPDDLRDFQ